MNKNILCLCLIIIGCNSRFVQEDIDNLKVSIKTEFEKNAGVTVSQVSLIKESDKKLTGFAKLKVKTIEGDVQVIKNCNATMGDDDHYIWECK